MEIARNIITVVYLIVCVILILITLLQNKDNNPMEDVAENPKANKYFEKNKSRTKSGRIQKNTIIIGVIFAILTIVLGILFVL